LGHEDESLFKRSLQKLLVVYVIAQSHTHIVNYGIIGMEHPEESLYYILEKNDA
jgi:hypothetical protein